MAAQISGECSILTDTVFLWEPSTEDKTVLCKFPSASDISSDHMIPVLISGTNREASYCLVHNIVTHYSCITTQRDSARAWLPQNCILLQASNVPFQVCLQFMIKTIYNDIQLHLYRSLFSGRGNKQKRFSPFKM